MNQLYKIFLIVLSAAFVSFNLHAQTPPPTPGTPTASTNTCGSKTLSFNGTPPVKVLWYWQTSPSGTSQDNSSSTFTATSSGTYYLRAYNFFYFVWSNNSSSVTVTVNQNPSTPSTPSVQDLCSYSTLTRGNPPGGVTWYWQTSSGGTSTANSGSTYEVYNAGTYYLRAMSAAGCWGGETSVYANPVIPPTSPGSPTASSNTCGNKTLTRNGSPSAPVYWYWQTVYNGTSTANAGPTMEVSSSGTYYIRAYDASTGCWSPSSGQVSTTVNPYPSTPATPTVSNQCGVSVLTHQGSPPSGTTWYWQDTNASGTDQSYPSSSYNTSSSNTYYIRSRDNSTGCWSVSSASAATSFNPIPGGVTAVTNDANCGAGQVDLSASYGSNGNTVRWYNASSGGSLLQTGTNYSPNISSTTTFYTSSYNTSTGCESTAARVAITGTINPTPAAVASVTGDANCGSGQVDLSATYGSNGNTVRWYNFSTGGSVIQTGASYSPTISSTTTYYTSSYNTSTACESTASRVAVTGTINAIPSAPTGNSASRCGTGTVTLTATTGTNGNTVRWYSASTGGTPLATGTSFTTPSISSTTIYYISSYHSTNTCESTSARVAVTATVNTVPAVPVVSGNGRFDTGTLALTGSGAPAGGTYNWYNPSNTLLATGSSYTTPVLSSSQANYLYAKAANSSGCESAATWVNITIAPVPVITGLDRVVMNKVTLNAGSGYDTYLWKNSSNVTVGTAQSFTTSQADTYTVTVGKSGISESSTSATFQLYAQHEGQDMNFVTTNSVLVQGVTNQQDIAGLSVDSVSQTVQYFDGLGRPIQSVVTKGSPTKIDIVQPVVYDVFGREAVKYQPYTSGSDGWFESDFLPRENTSYTTSPQYQFYQSTSKVAADIKPYAETVFEASPLNRVVKQGAPGDSWQPNATLSYASTDHTVKFAYESNSANEVLQWTYSYPDINNPFGKVESGSSGIYYPANQLFKSKTKDEELHEVIEFKDKEGKVVLKKVQANGEATLWAETYYVYDGFNNLVCVIPPEATKLITQTSPSSEYFGKTDEQKKYFLSRWAFRYKYDARKRMSEKSVPGADPVYMVYDKRDRLVLTQDGNQRNLYQWIYTKYDILNRPIMTGIYSHGSPLDQAGMTALISSTIFYETFDQLQTSTHGYTNTSGYFPSTNIQLLTATYYDNYDFKSLTSDLNFVNNDLTGQLSSEFLRVRGQATGSKINILGTTNYLYAVTYFDDQYRVVQTIAKNHKSGEDRVTNKYDFAGKVLETKRTYLVSGVTKTVKETFIYDHAGRVLTVKHSTNGAADVVLIKNEYNALGQLVDKKLHSTDNGTTFIQSVDYRYNIRGWLSSMNNSKLNNTEFNDDNNDLFGMELGYNSDLGLGATAQFNGNIAAIKWSNNTIESPVLQRGYAFTYDAMNRLKEAVQKEAVILNTWIGGNYNENGIEYDLNGNIHALQRKDGTGALIDNLTYDYGTGETASNKLLYVSDAADAAKGFVNGNTGTDDYAYDKNGNLIRDKNKGIANNNDIKYNHLNLPTEVIKGADKVKYYYDATGSKLYQEVYTGAAVTKTTDYVGELIFENNVLQFINHSEGRVMPDGASWEYQYHLKDHLGNVRTTFTAKQITDDKTATLETANANVEQAEFLKYTEAKKIQSYLFDRTNGVSPSTTTGFSQRLTGGQFEKYGLAKSLSVMPGDVVSAEVYAKYVDQNSANWTTAFNTLISQIAVNTTGVVSLGDNYGTSNNPSINIPASYADALATNSEAGPKAYLNWLVFKRDGTFVLEQSGFDRLSTVPKENGQDATHERLYSPSITITEPGFVYFYLSNEEGTPLEVYFDDFKVTQTTKTPVIQTDDYYPFGLTFNSYSRENSTANNYLYNGKELQDELDLGWYDYVARQYDPAIGRFMSLDPASSNYHSWTPYHYVMNNPIIFIDPTGMFTELYNEDGKKIGEDKNGNDGNVSIILNKDNAKRIAKDYKEGGIATEGDVNSGVKTTKSVLTEALDVLKRTEDNGGLKEESSAVTENGEVIRGQTGSEPDYEKTKNGITVQTASGSMPVLPEGTNKSNATLIHSHPTTVAEHDGQYFPQSASSPSGLADWTTFLSYGTNIIVGKLGNLSSIEKNSDGTVKDNRKSGAVFFNSRSVQKLALTKDAMKKITK